MAGFEDYGWHDGVSQGVPAWGAVEALYAAYNERMSLILDEARTYPGFVGFDLEEEAPESPGMALALLFGQFYMRVCVGFRGSRRPFFDLTARRISDPTGLSENSGAEAVLTEARTDQSFANLAWLCGKMGIATPTGRTLPVSEEIFREAFWFRPLHHAVDFLYEMIGGWKYHYEYCSTASGTFSATLDDPATRSQAFDAALAATPVEGTYTTYRDTSVSSSYTPLRGRTQKSSTTWKTSAYLKLHTDVSGIAPNRADEVISAVSDCAVSALMIGDGTTNWSALESLVPVGELVALPFPQSKVISMTPATVPLPDDIGSEDSTAQVTFSIRSSKCPICVYDLSPRLQFKKNAE